MQGPTLRVGHRSRPSLPRPSSWPRGPVQRWHFCFEDLFLYTTSVFCSSRALITNLLFQMFYKRGRRATDEIAVASIHGQPTRSHTASLGVRGRRGRSGTAGRVLLRRRNTHGTGQEPSNRVKSQRWQHTISHLTPQRRVGGWKETYHRSMALAGPCTCIDPLSQLAHGQCA